MAAIVWDPKDPGEDIIADLDWSADLGADTITNSQWAILTTDGSNLAIGTTSFTTTITQVNVSGGNDKFNYELKNTVTTAAGQTLIAVAMLPVRAKR